MFDEVVGEFRKMWRAEEYPGFDGKFFSMPPRNVLPKPYSEPAPADVGRGRQPVARSRRPRAWGSACCASRSAAPSRSSRSSRSTRTRSSNAEPVGDFVNDNIMVTTQLLCLEDGAAGARPRCNIGVGYHRSLLFRYLDTFPRPAGVPEWPALLPEPTPEALDAGDRRPIWS